MRPSKKENNTPPSSEISQILMDSEGLLKANISISKEAPIQEVQTSPDNGLDGSFQVEDKSYRFSVDSNESFYKDIEQGPFPATKPINKDLADKILFKEIKFPSPPKRGGKYKTDSGRPELLDPDDSLDIGTGTFQRKRPFSETGNTEKSKEMGSLFNEENIPTANTSFTKLTGFKTAHGSSLYISDECMDRSRRSFGFMESYTQSAAPSAAKLKPKVISPRENYIIDALEIYKKVKKEIFPLTRSEEEEYSLFSLFQWSWISVLPQIKEIFRRGGDMQFKEVERIVIEKAKIRWKQNPKSVLQRIVEKDEHPSVYMKVLVIEGGTNTIMITDGIHSVKAQLDLPLQKISNKITEGKILQVACSKSLLSDATSIYDVNKNGQAVIELQYNGVKPCSSGPLGYQSHFGFIRSILSIHPSGGYISCLMLKIARKIDVRYILDLNGSKSNIEEDRLDSTLERIEKSIEKIYTTAEEKNDALSKVRLRKYTRYDVICDYTKNTTPAILSIWEPAYSDNTLKTNQLYLFFMLSPPKKALSTGTILLTTTTISTFRPI
ncbi:hypothetical protein NEIRO03_1655 [Nematocida sp. AWRm78]|nr:hypothetical protein NEIRO02_1623 [Nematocida sp. AWRm79]KAI5184201.1 hypothetical protein NEIRO03_1655 [Nematocida sp. AWRm78]